MKYGCVDTILSSSSSSSSLLSWLLLWLWLWLWLLLLSSLLLSSLLWLWLLLWLLLLILLFLTTYWIYICILPTKLIFNSGHALKKLYHFCGPRAIFADTGVFKIRITILKSMQYVAFLWDLSPITSIKYLQQYLTLSAQFWWHVQFCAILWNCVELDVDGTSSSMELHGIPWNLECVYFDDRSSSMEFGGIPWNTESANFGDTSNSMEFHGTWNAPIAMTRAGPRNSMGHLLS